jgi:uncharacterized protein YbjT (DUF2867 family)
MSRIAVAGATGRVGGHLVELLEGQEHDVVPISRTHGVDLITGTGLDEALAGVQCVVDAATGPSPDQVEATEFFTTAARNLQAAGRRGGVERIVVVSIIGCDRFSAGYNVAKVAHERALEAGPIPVRVVRAAQFHEFVPLMLEWRTQGDVVSVPRMRTQPVAAETVAKAVARMVAEPEARLAEIAGPRAESLVELAKLYVSKLRNGLRVEEVSDPDDPDSELFADGGLLPGPHATLAGPTFAGWVAGVLGHGAVPGPISRSYT